MLLEIMEGYQLAAKTSHRCVCGGLLRNQAVYVLISDPIGGPLLPCSDFKKLFVIHHYFHSIPVFVFSHGQYEVVECGRVSSLHIDRRHNRHTDV